VIAYGTTTPPDEAAQLRERFLAANPELRGRRILLFLSRIHVKKGCDLLIRALAGFAAAQPSLHLVVAGPDQTGWVEKLQHLALRLGVGDRVSWPGMLRGDLKWGAFYSADAFILPSHQENFGIAVAEALGCGLPVLISNKVNIWREVQSHHAGIVAPDTEEGTRTLLREWLSLTAEERSRMGGNARALFKQRFTVDAMAAGLLELVAGRSVPDGVYSGW